MNYIKIIDAKDYMPRQKVYNDEIEKKFNLEEGYISKRTGIKDNNERISKGHVLVDER